MKNVSILLALMLLVACGGNNVENSQKTETAQSTVEGTKLENIGESVKMVDINKIPTQSIVSSSVDLPPMITSPEQIFCVTDGIVIKDGVEDNFLKFIPYSFYSVLSFGSVSDTSKKTVVPYLTQIDNENFMLSLGGVDFQIVTVKDNKISSKELKFSAPEMFYKGSKTIVPMLRDNYLIFKRDFSQVEIFNDNPGGLMAKTFYPFELNAGIKIANQVDGVFDTKAMIYSKFNNSLFIAYCLYPYFVVADMETKEITLNSRLETSLAENQCVVDSLGNAVYDKDPVIYYCNQAITTDYNWAYYRGYRSSDIGNKQPEIHQFTKDGELVKRYIVDRELTHFAVSPDNKTVYALCVGDDLKPKVVKFSF